MSLTTQQKYAFAQAAMRSCLLQHKRWKCKKVSKPTSMISLEVEEGTKDELRSYVSSVIRRQAKKLRIISITYKPHFKKKFTAIRVWGFSAVKDVHKSFVKSKQKICRCKMQGKPTSFEDFTAIPCKDSTVSNRFALFEYCLEKLPLLAYDHVSANKRALLPMLKNKPWAGTKVKGTADANKRKGHYQATNMNGRYGVKHKQTKVIKENGLLCLNNFYGRKVCLVWGNL